MIDLTPLDVRKKRGDFGKGLRGYDTDEVDAFLELVAERMEVLVKENLVFREEVDRLGEKVVLQEGREQAVQDALVTAQELRQDMKKQASREAKILEREARARIKTMIAESEKLLTEHNAALKEMGRHRDRFLKAFRTFLEREIDTIEVELGRDPLKGVSLDLELSEHPLSLLDDEDSDAEGASASKKKGGAKAAAKSGKAGKEGKAASAAMEGEAQATEAAEPAEGPEIAQATDTAEGGEPAGVTAASGEPLGAGSAAPEEESGGTEADGQRPPEEPDGGDSLWLSSIMMDRKEEDAE